MADKDSLILWRPLAVLKGHLSSVRSLAACSHGSKMAQSIDRTEKSFQNSCILFSGGGRAEIRAWKLIIENSKEIKAFYAEHVESSMVEPSLSQLSALNANRSAFSNLDTAISKSKAHLEKEFVKNELLCQHEHLSTYFLGESRHKKMYTSWKAGKLKLDPETRIMAIHATPLHELIVLDKNFEKKGTQDSTSSSNNSGHMSHILSVAGSDGYLRYISNLCLFFFILLA